MTMQTVKTSKSLSEKPAIQSLSTLKKLIDQGYLQVSQPPGMRRVFIKGSSILHMLDQTIVNGDNSRQVS